MVPCLDVADLCFSTMICQRSVLAKMDCGYLIHRIVTIIGLDG